MDNPTIIMKMQVTLGRGVACGFAQRRPQGRLPGGDMAEAEKQG
jgi:hypothetical protein